MMKSKSALRASHTREQPRRWLKKKELEIPTSLAGV